MKSIILYHTLLFLGQPDEEYYTPTLEPVNRLKIFGKNFSKNRLLSSIKSNDKNVVKTKLSIANHSLFGKNKYNNLQIIADRFTCIAKTTKKCFIYFRRTIASAIKSKVPHKDTPQMMISMILHFKAIMFNTESA